jgi:putative endonuclease
MRQLWNRLFGDAGERAAARYLRRLGFRIVCRQYRNAFGEIDLIAIDGEWLVFVEVKTRRSDQAGRPEEAVTGEKQRRVTRTARAFIRQRKLEKFRSRFDVVGVTWREGNRKPAIEHIPHAFSAGD